jgi:hypothetical protein
MRRIAGGEAAAPGLMGRLSWPSGWLCGGIAVGAVALAFAVLAAPAAAAPKLPSLSGIVWTDADGDGIREARERVARGVRVVLQRKRGRRFVRVTGVATTRAGRWSFRLRATGRYRARVALPSTATGFSPRNAGRNDKRDSDVRSKGPARGATPVLKARRGARSRRFDAGLLPPPPPPPPPVAEPPRIGDTVWRDEDNDGIRDPGEPGLAGVTVELWDAARTAAVASTTSDASGRYELRATTGSYRVRVVLPTGAIYSPTDQGGDDAADSDVNKSGPDTGFTGVIDVTADRADVDIGVAFPAGVALGDYVWRDADGDGAQEGAEPAEAGVVVELWNENRTQVLASTTSTAAGAYVLLAPRGATYLLRFRPSGSGDAFTRQGATGDASDSNVIPAGPDAGWTAPIAVTSDTPAAILTIDAGVITPIAVGDLVWDDLNVNGIQEAGEPGLAGASVQLWNAAKTSLIGVTTTNAAGNYQLIAPTPGTYRVRVLLPTGAAVSPMDQGASDLLDSDINPSGLDLGFTAVYTLAAGVGSITHVDAGLNMP